MYKLIKYCRYVTIAFMLLAGSLALAEGKPTAKGKSPGKGKGENKGWTGDVNPGNDGKSGQLPSGWSRGDKDGWKGAVMPTGLAKKPSGMSKENPPGWSHGDKDGWKGAGMPPGLEKKTPPGWEKWNNNKKKGWEKRLENALGNIRKGAKNKKGFSKKDLDSALVSVEAAAREGVPVKNSRELVELAMNKGIQGTAIETLSRATSSGVGKDIDFGKLNKFVEKKLDDGLRNDELLNEIYKEIDNRADK